MLFWITGPHTLQPLMKSFSTKTPASLPCPIRPPFSDITNHSPDLFGAHWRSITATSPPHSHMDRKRCVQDYHRQEQTHQDEISMEDLENEGKGSDSQLPRPQAYEVEASQLCLEMLRETHGCEPYLFFS